MIGSAEPDSEGLKVEPATETRLTRAEYFTERQLLIEARQRGYQRAEQMVIGGATGALLLSVTFLERLVPATTVRSAWLLMVAWCALLLCLSASLYGQFTSARSFTIEIARLEATLHGEPVPANCWAVFYRAMSAASAVLLIVGILLLACFAYINAPFNQ